MTPIEAATERYRTYHDDSYAESAQSYEDSGQLGRDESTLAQSYLATLDPPWLDEPTCEGEWHVEGIYRVCFVYREDTEGNAWAVEFIKTDPGTLVSEIVWEPLNNRRVAPCVGRPKEAT